MYIFTRVFNECFSCGICVQYGGFSRMKHPCNAAMPVACTVSLQYQWYFANANNNADQQHLKSMVVTCDECVYLLDQHQDRALAIPILICLLMLSVFDLYSISMLLVEVRTLSLNVILFSFGSWLLCWLEIYKTPIVNYVTTVCKIPFGSHQRV